MVFFNLHDRMRALQTLFSIKRIVDEVAAESIDDVTTDFNDEVVVDAACDVTVDFVDKVEHAKSESPKNSDSTKNVLEVADLYLALVTCVMRIVVEVCGDSLLSAVFRKSISEISVVLPILVAPWMQKSVGLRNDIAVDAASFDEIVVADAASEIIASATDIAADLVNDTAIAISTLKEISVVDDFYMEDMAEVHDSCNVVLVGGYEQEDVIDAVDLTAIISQDKECEPRRADVDVTKAIGLVADVMAWMPLMPLILRWTSREKFVVYGSMTNRSVVARLEIFLVFATTSRSHSASTPLSYEAPLVEEFPATTEVPVFEKIHIQGFVRNEFVADLEVAPEVCSNIDNAVGHGIRAEGTSFPMATTSAGGQHLDNIDLIVVLWKVLFPWTWLWSYGRFCFHRLGCGLMEGSVSVDLVVILWKTWLSSYGRFCFRRLDCRLMEGTSSATHVIEEDANAGIIGEIVVTSSLSRPTTRMGSSVESGTIFSKLGVGLGGPMFSLLSSVLAAMSKSDLGSVTKIQILAWKSVVQDFIEVGFDVGFMIGHLQQIAQHLFGKKVLDEMQVL
uniref:Uncharacterized protein n=1 Tax=Fagus sylvatica TaxID=28930 RepID=A0A2N9IK73_FAGSY